MRIAICDDTEPELTHLSKLIAEYRSCRGIQLDCRLFHNGTELLRNVKGGDYDLIFLDVLMPGVNGLQIAHELKELDKNVKLILISASPNFALESYSVGAYYYLLKPADTASLFPLLDKAEKELSRQDEQGFVLKNRKGIIRISFSELEYVEVINKKVFFYLTDGTIHEATASLSEYENMLLSRPEFLKIHRSYLVNLNHIQAINNHSIVTKNRHRIPISRQRRTAVQDAYIQFLHQRETDLRMPDTPMAPASEQAKRYDAWRILLVDDNAADRAFWGDVLQRHGCIVYPAQNGETALALAAEQACDCVLLDVKLPDEDGFSICQQLRKLVRVPVIFLSCMTEPDSQMEGFAVGGIDYITKDTSAELFWAKVETRIRLALSDRTRFCYGPLLLNLAEHKALINGRELFLTSAEFDILWQLSEHPEQVFSPEEIFHMIWSEEPWDGGRTVQMHMSRLRRKLETAWEEHHFIETVWGQGYRFVPIAGRPT